MSTAALYTIAKTQKQPEYPLTEKWIKMWYIHTNKLTIRKKEMLFKATWMDLEIIILSEGSQRKKKMYSIIYMWNPKRRASFIEKE